MSDNKLQIICIGDSHLASFSKALKATITDGNHISLKFCSITFMTSSWYDFEESNYLGSFNFKPDNPAGLQDFVIDPEKKTILVMIGPGLSGNTMFRLFGPLLGGKPDETANGYSSSPLMPCIYGNKANKISEKSYLSERKAPYYSINMCKALFAHSIDRHLKHMKDLISNSSFDQIYSIPSPMMPDHVARWMFGDDYCDSGCQAITNDLYLQTLEERTKEMKLTENIITFSTEFETELGFIKDRYANSPKLNDYHANSSYYEHITTDLFGRIEKKGLKPLI